ncbi:hypothetical protein [Lentzea kentuckyensis]|nr:hypothetical protein [Lentzea kentuckyensis]
MLIDAIPAAALALIGFLNRPSARHSSGDEDTPDEPPRHPDLFKDKKER